MDANDQAVTGDLSALLANRNMQSEQPPLADINAAPSAAGPAPTPAPPPLAPAPPGPAATALQDPSFAAFVAQRAKDLGVLKDAQTKAEKDRRWADVGNDFRRAQDGFMGRETNEAALQARLDDTNKPVANVLQQQKFNRDETEGAGADADLQGKLQQRAVTMAMMDPNSDLSKRADLLGRATGVIPRNAPPISANEFEMVKAGATFQQARDQHTAELARLAAKDVEEAKYHRGELAQGAATLAEHSRHNKAEEAVTSGKLGMKPLGAPVESELQSYVDATDAIDQLKMQQNKSGVVGTALGVGEGGIYNKMKDALADSLAKAESRGRTNPAAAAKISALLPSGAARSVQANAYFDTKRKQLVDSLESRVKELKASGVGAAEIGAFEDQLGRIKAAGPEAQMHKVLPPGASEPVLVPAADLAAAIANGGKQVD